MAILSIEDTADIGADILTGQDAHETFGHLIQRDPEEMRRQNAEAFHKINLLTLQTFLALWEGRS